MSNTVNVSIDYERLEESILNGLQSMVMDDGLLDTYKLLGQVNGLQVQLAIVADDHGRMDERHNFNIIEVVR